MAFCDLRGFTAFAEQAHPEQVMDVLSAYHEALGRLIVAYEGTLERFVGDGLVVLLNDPMPVSRPPGARSSHGTRDANAGQRTRRSWRKSGHQLGFGIGIAQGEATLGRIGFHGRLDYAAIGRVPNLASRLCSEARAGQVLVNERAFLSVHSKVDCSCHGNLQLKGIGELVPAYVIDRWRGS